MKDQELRITPLGAAIVEALPDQKKVRQVNSDFQKRKICPASELFNAKEVESFYRERGQKIKAG